MSSPRYLYIAAMCVAGLVLAIVGKFYPGIASGPVPPLFWLLIVSFVIDLALMQLAARTGAPPLAMEWRFGGFMAGALVYLGIVLVSGEKVAG
jgi:hypothetical protein